MIYRSMSLLEKNERKISIFEVIIQILMLTFNHFRVARKANVQFPNIKS